MDQTDRIEVAEPAWSALAKLINRDDDDLVCFSWDQAMLCDGVPGALVDVIDHLRSHSIRHSDVDVIEI